ncbi:unnamed protein product [Callosobruchus maculatus]|uniref:C2H2-type domain-containing protein n=1 Tax=Callosobruchus maculatus TaxID=64391 RepID=A0A653BUE2_CALMS|nr:unnamed protein product [Callosobruchus maculatus]
MILTRSPLVRYDCDICKKHYESAFRLRRHKLTIHNDVDLSVICEICGKRISTKEKLKFHMRTHTRVKPYPCDICDLSVICEICGKRISTKEKLKFHMRTHTGVKPYPCEICGKCFSKKHQLSVPGFIQEKSHIFALIVGGDSYRELLWCCTSGPTLERGRICVGFVATVVASVLTLFLFRKPKIEKDSCEANAEVKRRRGRKKGSKNKPKTSTEGTEGDQKSKKSRRKSDNPRKLMMAHPPPIELKEPIPCDNCEETFTNNVDFALHSLIHSNDGKYACHMCNYRNVSKYHVEMHVRAHEGSTKYKCEICGKAFIISTHAIEHKNFHTGEKPFQCEICGKHFMFSWHLASHRRTSHYEILTGKPLVKFDCASCNKHYESASGLRRHNIKKHKANEIDLSVICEICGKKLSSKEKLKFHIRTHTGYRPHACHVCPKSFSKKDQLIEHIRTHTGEKPYVCKICGKGFAQRTPLKTHEKTHRFTEDVAACRVCNSVYRNKADLENHVKSCFTAQLAAQLPQISHIPQIPQIPFAYNYPYKIEDPQDN